MREVGECVRTCKAGSGLISQSCLPKRAGQQRVGFEPPGGILSRLKEVVIQGDTRKAISC